MDLKGSRNRRPPTVCEGIKVLDYRLKRDTFAYVLFDENIIAINKLLSNADG